MSTDTPSTPSSPLSSLSSPALREYGCVALATLALGFPLARMLLPALAMLLLAVPPLLLLVWGGGRMVFRPAGAIQSPVGWPLLLFVIALVSSSLFAVVGGAGPGGGANVLPVLFFWGGMVGVLLFLTIDRLAAGWPPHIITRALLLIITILLVHASWTVVSAWGAWLSGWARGAATQPPTVPPDVIGMHHTAAVMPFIFGLPLAIVALWRATARWRRIVWGGWLFFDVVVIFYTSSRGGWVTMVAAVGATLAPLLWMATRAGQVQRIGKTLLLTGSYAILFVVLFLFHYTTLLHPLAGLPPTSEREGSETIAELTNPMGRTVFWQNALSMAGAHPLLGVGPGNYSDVYRIQEPQSVVYVPPHAHNISLAVLSELGLFGAVSLALLAVAIVRGLWRGWQQTAPLSDERLLLVAGSAVGVALVVNGLVDVPPPQNGAIVLFALAAALSTGGGWRIGEVLNRGAWRARLFPLLLVSVALLAWGVATLVFVLS